MRDLNRCLLVMYHDPVSNLVKLGNLWNQSQIPFDSDSKLIGCNYLNREYRTREYRTLIGTSYPMTDILCDYELMIKDGLICGIAIGAPSKGMKCMKNFLGSVNCRSFYNISHANFESLSMHYINSPDDFLLQASLDADIYLYKSTHGVDYTSIDLIGDLFVWKGAHTSGVVIEDLIILFDVSANVLTRLNFRLETKNLPEPMLA